MLNILYCFDENYNKQTFISIYSILRLLESNQKISVYIIHKNPSTFEKYAKKLQKYENLEKINVYLFEDSFEFPQLEKAHVSEATYYRLMIENYIPKDIDNLIYLDSDVIALNNPYNSCQHVLSDLNEKDETIGVSTELFKTRENTHFENIELNGYKYFNAGVMFINYKKWKKSNLKTTFLDKVQKYKDVIKLWDQDILNNYFDGSYYEISSLLNFRVNTNNNLEFLMNNVIFYHFSGDHKPWLLKGSLDDTAMLFFKINAEIDKEPYFFERKTGRITFLKMLIANIFSLRFVSIKNKRNYIKSAIKGLI
jgi:lipopolysaccharide biosynthesis glycosyltransferase